MLPEQGQPIVVGQIVVALETSIVLSFRSRVVSYKKSGLQYMYSILWSSSAIHLQPSV